MGFPLGCDNAVQFVFVRASFSPRLSTSFKIKKTHFLIFDFQRSVGPT